MIQQQSPKIENAKKVDQRKKEEGVKETVQEVETKDEVSSKRLSMKYSGSSSEASDAEEKFKQSSAPVAAPQIVEVKHEESDNEGKDSPVVVKKSTSLTESTSSLSGSSDSSSSSSEDSDSEHSDSTKSPREATPVKKLNEESETKKKKEQRVIEPVTFTFEHTTGQKKVETKDSQAPAFHSPPAHDTHLENESRLKYNEEAKPSTSITQSATMPEVKMEGVRQERRSSTASTTSASSSTISSSGSFSSSSSSSSEDSKSENQTSRSRADGNPPQEEPVIESTQAKNSFEFAEKIKIKETEDTSKMEEKIDVTVAIETVPQPETKGDDPVQRRNSDMSVSSLASSSSSSVSSSSTEGSLVIKDEGGSLVLEDEKVLLVQKDGDVQITEGNAGVKQSDQTNHQKAIENIDEIQEGLSESGSKESQILDYSEKPKDDIELVDVPSIQRVVAPITMTDNEINEIEETNESEDSSSSDSESDSSSSSESSGSQKGSRPGSSVSNKSNEEKNKLKLAFSPVITIQHADTYSSKPSESLEQTNPSPAPYEVPQPPTNSHVHVTKFDKEDELKQSEVDETSQTLINDTNEDSVTSGSQTNAAVHFVRSHPPEPREGSILYELEKGHQIVDIKNIKLNKLQIQEAVAFLKAKQSMSQLSLVNCDLHDQDIQMLKDAVIASPSKPVVLNLSENLLTSACVPHILDLVKRKPSIEAVLLTGSNLGDNGVKQLVDGLLEQYKDSFEVDGEDVQSGEDGSKGLCELDLANCNIGDEGIEALGSLIRSGMAIDTLNLSLNTTVTQKGWVTFAQALSKAKVLETLALDNNDIGNEGLEEIARSLYDNSSLAALDLNNIHITDKGGKYLVELLKRNTFILEINLQENSLSNQLIEDINKYISLNKSINKD